MARALSKLGFCSRSQAWALIQAGRVRVNGGVRRDPEWRVEVEADRIEVDDQAVRAKAKVYLMLNKPRGLVTTLADEQGRATASDCLAGQGLPFVTPVGRLDKASEGLLLFSNDTEWAAGITHPGSRLDKLYHVQVDRVADDGLARRLEAGVKSEGEYLAAKRATMLRQGSRTSWLAVVLDEGKNRQLRRLLGALGVAVLRLVRVAVGPLRLGDLAKGKFRQLTGEEVRALAEATRRPGQGECRPSHSAAQGLGNERRRRAPIGPQRFGV